MTTSGPGALSVRQITDIHSNWSAQGEDTDGKFSFQLVLDDGAEETIIRPTAEDAFVVLQLVPVANSLFFDTTNRVLIFGALALTGSRESA